MNTAIILAGGKGSRMKMDLPKCAVEILGKPMIEYLVDTLDKVNLNQVICVVGYKKEKMMEILKDRVTYAIQQEQLGTANAVQCALEFLDDDGYCVILPGDTPLIDEDILNQLIDTHLKNHNQLTLATIFLDIPTGYGRIVRKDDGTILKIVEESEATYIEKAIKEVNTGIYCIENACLKEALQKIPFHLKKKEYYLTDIAEIIPFVGSFTIEDNYKIRGINDLSTLCAIENECRKKIIEKNLKNGVHLIQPDTIQIGMDVTIGEGTTIYPGCVIMGKTRIGKSSVIGPYSELVHVDIADGVTIRQSVVQNSQIGKHSQIGPYAHIRMNTLIGEECRIGNYVEIKNSVIGNHTKVAHLTYIGDTDCGSDVNWGCGCVTVNYDGKTKFRTIIGDHVFIGCNSNLIAPIHIESNSFIAAGSTITEDMNEGDFAIARARTIIKKDYASKYNCQKK